MMTALKRNFWAGTSVLALAACTFAAGASAADFGKGAPGLKGSYGHKVAHVPAPAPIPEYEARYYVGLELGYAFSSSGTINETVPLGITPTAESMDDQGGQLNGGFTIGRYITPSLRGELSFSFRNDQGIGQTNESYGSSITLDGPTRQVEISPLIPPVLDGGGNVIVPGSPAVFQEFPTTDVHDVTVERRERSDYQFQTGLVSLIYDFHNGSRFTPFIGAGAGLTLYTLKRTISESVDCQRTTNTFVDPINNTTDITNYPSCVGFPTTSDVRESETATSWGYSLAAMAGVSIDVADSTKLDLGYRALYTSGTVSLGLPSATGLGSSVIKIEDRLDHELRVGMRWDIN